MFHNLTNQTAVFTLNRKLPDDPPSGYTQNVIGSRLFDTSKACLSAF